MNCETKELEKAFSRPKIIIDKLVVDNKEVAFSNNINLASNISNFQMHYTGLSKNKPDKIPFYKYHFTPENNNGIVNWTRTNSRVLNINNPSSGDYFFELVCIDGYNQTSNLITSRIKIEPKFTETTHFLLICILGVLGASILFWNIRTRQLKKKLSLELRLSNAELSVIRNQMNPHFVFNALSAMQYYIFSGKKLEANLYLRSLAKLMRKSLSFSRQDYISLDEEIDYIQEYLLLEKMRFRDKFDYEIKCNDFDNGETIYLPSLMTQPIVENCIKHAFRNIDYQGRIDIEYNIFESRIAISIIDNGVGFDRDEKDIKLDSVGISIVTKRIELLNEKLKSEDSTFIYDDTFVNGTKCLLTLPIEKR